MRVHFTGVIFGAVEVQKDETPENAVGRAESDMNDLMESASSMRALSNYVGDDAGPTIRLHVLPPAKG